ncbi:MAG: TRAP transporter large permease [Pirellulales bacterium]
MTDPYVLAAICTGLLFGLILMQVPVGGAMLAAGLVGISVHQDAHTALIVLVNETTGMLTSLDLATIPLFLIMGALLSAAGYSKDIYDAIAALVGHRRGGLSYATIGGCAVFGSVCGSSTATVATFTKAALPEMLARGYSPAIASGSIAAGGALKSLIPPSTAMILYAVATNTFVIDLFRAALLPMLITIALNMIAIAIAAHLVPKAFPVALPRTFSQRRAALANAVPVLALLLLVFGGLYGGVFTVNEAASVAAVLALLLCVVRRRLTWRSLLEGLCTAAEATAMIYIIMLGATIFGYFLGVVRVPELASSFVGSLDVPPLLIIALLLLFYLVLGAIFDEIAAMLITLPFVLPIVVGLGYDPIWWGIINLIIIELGMIVPPIGIAVFIIHGMMPSISLRVIYGGVMPFVVADLFALAVLTLFPVLSLIGVKILGGG